MRRLSLSLAAALAASLIPALAGHGAAVASSKAPARTAPGLIGDFNGDGFADLAVGVPGDVVSGKDEAGAVNVIYGGAAGLTADGNQLWSQDSSGITGTAGTKDHFAEAVAVGDFNGDGFDDLAVGVPDDDPGSVTDAGAVNVIYGSAAGLTSTGNQLWSQDSAGIKGTAQKKDAFGRSLATGDFDGDGFADLAVGVPHDSTATVHDVGAVNVIYGSAAGLTSTGNQGWDQDSSGIKGTAESGDLFGRSLAAADFDGDGFADLAAGVPGDNPGTKNDAGAVNVIYGTASGLDSSGNQGWTQDSLGIPGTAQAGDNFGYAVAAADFGNGSQADLAAGVPGEDLSGATDGGGLNVIYGGAAGLSSSGAQYWDENTAGIVGGPAGTADNFGNSLAAGDMGNGSQADLAIGVPGKDISLKDKAGAVNVIYGGASGLTTTGNQQWNQDSPNILGTADPGDNFGYSVAVQDFGNGTPADLVAGVPFEDTSSSLADTGTVNVIYGTAGGLSSTGNQRWTQGADGILGTADPGDQMGAALA